MVPNHGNFGSNTVDDKNPALPSGPETMGNSGIYLLMGKAGFISSTVGARWKA